MKDKDHKLLQEAYTDVVKEMAYRPLMPYYSKKPSVEKVGNVKKSDPEYEQRKVNAGLKINENLNILKSDPNKIDVAWDTINIMNNFIDRDAEKEREEFLVGEEELTYFEILEKILEYTTTTENNPELLKKKINPNTGMEESGLTVDQYIKGDPKKERTADHYYLFRTILDSLPDVKTQVRSRRETELGQEKQAVPLFYFADKKDVYYKGNHIGYLNTRLFWPNEKGKELEFEEVGFGKWRKFFTKHGRDITLENKRLEPFFTFTWDTGEPIEGYLFPASNIRQPRRPSEPKKAPPPYPFNEYQPQQLVGKTLDEIKVLLHSDEAEKKFRELYPEEDYAGLYKKGKISSVINAPEF